MAGFGRRVGLVVVTGLARLAARTGRVARRGRYALLPGDARFLFWYALGTANPRAAHALVCLKDAGHAVHLDRPVRYARLVGAFLRAVRPPDAPCG